MQRQRQPDQHLLGEQHGILGRDEDDRGGDEAAEEHAHRDGEQRRAPERCNALGQPRVMEHALGLGVRVAEALLEEFLGRRRRHRRVDVAALRVVRDGAGDDMGDPILGRARSQRELLVVAGPAVRIAQDPARVVDEPQRLLDVAVAVAGLRVVLADHAPQRVAHFLVRRVLRNAQRFVEGGLHRAACPDGNGGAAWRLRYDRHETACRLPMAAARACNAAASWASMSGMVG